MSQGAAGQNFHVQSPQSLALCIQSRRKGPAYFYRRLRRGVRRRHWLLYSRCRQRMPGKATQDEILFLQQQVNEQSDKGELISEIEQVREESRVCTKEGVSAIGMNLLHRKFKNCHTSSK